MPALVFICDTDFSTIIMQLSIFSPLISGMKPLLYSEREATAGGLGWKRVGFNISYYKTSSYKNPLLQREYVYYTLSFYMVSLFKYSSSS